MKKKDRRKVKVQQGEVIEAWNAKVKELTPTAKKYGHQPSWGTPVPPINLEHIFNEYIAPAGPAVITSFMMTVNYYAIQMAMMEKDLKPRPESKSELDKLKEMTDDKAELRQDSGGDESTHRRNDSNP